MKKLLVLPMVLLSLCVMADERVFLGSFERQTQEFDFEYVGFSVESSLNGFGGQFLNFVDSGYYFGGKFAYLTGESEVCVGSQCVTANTDISQTIISGEVGWNYGDWTPFFGLSFNSEESEGSSSDYTSFSTGAWLDFDKFQLRGAITQSEQSNVSGSRTWLSGGFLYQMDNDWALGAEVGLETGGDGNGFRFSLQFGRSFQF